MVAALRAIRPSVTSSTRVRIGRWGHSGRSTGLVPMTVRHAATCIVALALVLAACGSAPTTEVLSASRQAVDAPPARVVGSSPAGESLNDPDVAPSTEPAEPAVPVRTLPETLAFRGDAATAIGGVEGSSSTTTTTSTAAPPTTAPAESTTTPPEQTITTTVAEDSGACGLLRFDTGALDRSVRADGRVDADGSADVVHVGYDDDGAIRVVVDFANRTQTGVGTLPAFGEAAARFRIDFTGNPDQPFLVHRGSSSLAIEIVDCVPVGATNS